MNFTKPFLLLVIIFLGRAVPTSADQWSISQVSIVDIESGRILPNQTVIVQDDRIFAVRATQPGDSVGSVDGTGLFLIPSLFDCHVHWNQPVRDALLFASYGVGFVRDMAGNNDERLRLRQRAEAGEFFGIRCVVTGAILDGADPYHPAISIVCDNPESGREAVRRQHSAGVNYIKAYSKLKPDVLDAICDEAKKHNIRVVGHAPDSMPLLAAARAGMTTNEHLSRVETLIEAAVPVKDRPKSDTNYSYGSVWWSLYSSVESKELDRVLGELADTGMVQCPTLTLVAGYARIPPGQETLAAWQRFAGEDEFQAWTTKPQQWAAFVDSSAANWPRILDFVGRMDKAGIKMVTGTDLGNPYAIAGYSLHDEMNYLSAAGLSNQKILAAASIEAARLFEVDKDYGSIAAGKLANFVALRANPLESIRNTLAIESVTLRGVRMDRSKLDAMQGEAESFKDFTTPGVIELSPLKEPGTLISNSTFTHRFQAWETGEEERLLYENTTGFLTRTVDRRTGWGSIPTVLDQYFDSQGALLRAEWRVFAKLPYGGSLTLVDPDAYELRIEKGASKSVKRIDIETGTQIVFPMGNAFEPRQLASMVNRDRIPTMTLSFNGEPAVSGFRTVRLESQEAKSKYAIDQQNGLQETQLTVIVDSNFELLEQTNIQGALTQSIKRKE
jgi:imidazolonepropionase-like amidohydrolase